MSANYHWRMSNHGPVRTDPPPPPRVRHPSTHCTGCEGRHCFRPHVPMSLDSHGYGYLWPPVTGACDQGYPGPYPWSWMRLSLMPITVTCGKGYWRLQVSG